jgi:hypothetical protein
MPVVSMSSIVYVPGLSSYLAILVVLCEGRAIFTMELERMAAFRVLNYPNASIALKKNTCSRLIRIDKMNYIGDKCRLAKLDGKISYLFPDVKPHLVLPSGSGRRGFAGIAAATILFDLC